MRNRKCNYVRIRDIIITKLRGRSQQRSSRTVLLLRFELSRSDFTRHKITAKELCFSLWVINCLIQKFIFNPGHWQNVNVDQCPMDASYQRLPTAPIRLAWWIHAVVSKMNCPDWCTKNSKFNSRRLSTIWKCNMTRRVWVFQCAAAIPRLFRVNCN